MDRTSISTVGLCVVLSFLSAPAAHARFLQVDPVGYKDDLDLYVYTSNDPLNKVDPKGTDAVLVTDKTTGTVTLVIPVHFSGSSATDTNVQTIVQRDNTLNTGGSTIHLQVISTDKPINGVLNKMDFSPGNNTKMCGSPGECVNKLGGNDAHINSANGQATDAAAHDILHFAGVQDQYQEGPPDSNGNRTSTPTPGYDNTNIMTSRSGTNLNPNQLQQAVGNQTTKHCTVSQGSNGQGPTTACSN